MEKKKIPRVVECYRENVSTRCQPVDDGKGGEKRVQNENMDRRRWVGVYYDDTPRCNLFEEVKFVSTDQR